MFLERISRVSAFYHSEVKHASSGHNRNNLLVEIEKKYYLLPYQEETVLVIENSLILSNPSDGRIQLVVFESL